MNRRRRTSLEIVFDILSLFKTRPKLRKTAIMYGAQLGFLERNRYVEFMKHHNLLTEGGKFWYITAKGKAVFRAIARCTAVMEAMMALRTEGGDS